MSETALNSLVVKIPLINSVLKTVFFLVLGLAATFGTFFLENNFVDKGQILEANFTGFDYQKENIIPDNGIIRFLSPADSQNPLMEVQSATANTYIFKLNSGKLWANFAVSAAKVNIVAGPVVIIPDQAVFDLSLQDSKISLNVYDGDVYVGFLPEGLPAGQSGATVFEYMDPYSVLFMNRLLVPRENQVSIPLKKVNEEIRPLLYSKLVKEFKYSSLPDGLKELDWVKNNSESDKKFIGSLKQQFVADVLYKGAEINDGFMNNFIFWAEENLTFIPEKKRTMILEHLFNYLEDAVFYAGQGMDDKSAASWQAFEDYSATIPSDILSGQEFNGKLDDYIDRLKLFSIGDNEYKISKFLRDKKFIQSNGKYQVVSAFWHDVYRALNDSEALVEEALNNYYEYFDKTRAEVVAKNSADAEIDDDFYRMYLTYQNQLFDNLLMKYGLFYKDGYFAIKSVLENDLLKLYEKGQLKDELKQFLVSNKINFLKRLKRFFFDGEIEVKETKEIFKRLFGEIDEFMPSDDSGVAVVKLFESQLDDMDDFWGYLNSPEYHAKTYGAKHEDRYKVYLNERETIWNFINIKEDVLGEVSNKDEDITVVDIVEEIEKSLKSNSNVTTVEVGKFDNVDQRYIEVKIVLGGYPVNAKYDRDSGTLKDVKVYDEVISDGAVKLDNLLTVLQQKFADLADKKSGKSKAGDETVETTAQRFARTYIAKTISEFGFNIVADDVVIIDQPNAVYRVKDVTFKEYTDMKITFDVLMSGEFATNVLVSVKGTPRVLDGQYPFEELATVVQAAYDFSGKIKENFASSSKKPIPR
ncbi:MAG: hypothetical protein AAB953_02555 [Patescibacteria group bacterium]